MAADGRVMATRRAVHGKKASSRSGATLIPMRSSDGMRAFILEQLSGVRDLRARAMFGGLGLYAGDAFFGLVARDALYLKVNDSNRGAYEDAGMAPFRLYADRPMTMGYWQVPAGVLEDTDDLLVWARTAIAVAQAVRVKPRRPAAAGRPRTPPMRRPGV